MDCVPTGDKTILVINALFHSAILLTFLSGFYMFYGSKIETKSTNEKFADILGKNLEEILKKGNQETGGELKQGLSALNPLWEVLERRYSKPDPTVKTYNRWLFRFAATISIFMVILLAVVLIILKFSCGHCPWTFFWDIIKENVIIFSGIGIVEYLFFKNVALKLIPAPPSLMIDQVVTQIKDGIF